VTYLPPAWLTVPMAVSTPQSVAAAAPAPDKDDRPAYRPFRASVRTVTQLSPHFVRITLTGPQLGYFGTDGDDQRIKLLFPAPNGRLTEVGADDDEAIRRGTWYEDWRTLPEEERSPMRTYTVRAVRPQLAEVDVDMVTHGDGGPASRWVQRAVVGDELVVVGPDSRSIHSAGGRDWAPGAAQEMLLAGDETAAPAICAILEALEPGRTAHGFIEVPTSADFLDVHLPEGADITWLAREEHPHGHALVPAVRDWAARNLDAIAPAKAVVAQSLEDVDVDAQLLWDSPVLQVQPIDSCGRGERCGGEFYAWFAGEAGVIKTLRRFLVSEVGVCRRRVAFMGYWRQGRAEGQ